MLYDLITLFTVNNVINIIKNIRVGETDIGLERGLRQFMELVMLSRYQCLSSLCYVT